MISMFMHLWQNLKMHKYNKANVRTCVYNDTINNIQSVSFTSKTNLCRDLISLIAFINLHSLRGGTCRTDIGNRKLECAKIIYVHVHARHNDYQII